MPEPLNSPSPPSPNSIKVRIADINHSAAQTTASEINKSSSTDLVSASTDKVDVASWESQVSAFEDALKDLGGRIDYVFPIAGVGEKPSIINDPSKKSGFEKPALVPIEVNLTGVIYTLSLAVQQFRRQEVDGNGFRGKSESWERRFKMMHMLTNGSRYHGFHLRSLLRAYPADLYGGEAVCIQSPSQSRFFSLYADHRLLLQLVASWA